MEPYCLNWVCSFHCYCSCYCSLWVRPAALSSQPPAMKDPQQVGPS
jgi:hypothetical protein